MGLCCTGLATSPFCVVRVVRLRWDTGPQLAGQSRYSVTKILRKIRATTFTERLRKITREGRGAPGMSNAASD